MADKKPADVAVFIEFENTTVRIPINEIIKKFALGGNPNIAGITVTKDSRLLKSFTSLNEAEYPSIYTDAEDENKETIWLANAELPNEDYPDSITARLYAGYEALGKDEPIEKVTVKLLTKQELKERTEKHAK